MRAVEEATKTEAEKVDAEVFFSKKTGGDEEEEKTDVVKLGKDAKLGESRLVKQAIELQEEVQGRA